MVISVKRLMTKRYGQFESSQRLFAGIALFLSIAFLVPCLAETQGTSSDEDARRADAQKVLKEKIKPFVENYCAKCHGSRAKAGINLQSALKNPNGESSTLHFEKAAANVKVHDMPPEDSSKKPSNEERRQFIEWIGKIKYLAPRDPGPFVIRRLTKTEYANTLNDLYGVDRSIADVLPDEVEGEGFLNSISPLQSELFLDIANQVTEKIIAPKGQAPTAVQKRLFGSLPSKEADLRKEARKVARSLARDAYRRPASESELDVLTDVYDLGRKNDLDHTGSLSLMLKAVLVSPQFLFITPAGEPESKDKILPLDDYQLSSRLSYLLWSAPPDAELAALADKAELQKPGTLKKQVERLLKVLFQLIAAEQLVNVVFDQAAEWILARGEQFKPVVVD